MEDKSAEMIASRRTHRTACHDKKGSVHGRPLVGLGDFSKQIIGEPEADGSGKAGWLRRGDPLDVDSGNQCVERQAALIGRRFQQVPEQWFQRNGGLMPGNRDAAFDWRMKYLGSLYIHPANSRRMSFSSISMLGSLSFKQGR